MNLNVAVLVGAALLATSSIAADLPTVRIDSPKTNSIVDQRQEMSGTVFPASAEVWVVIRPTETSDFWVQRQITVGNDGKWTVEVYFGDPGETHSGKKYEVRAFANPSSPLKEGKGKSWPKSAAQSDLFRYSRR
jgi:hypothetical protein